MALDWVLELVFAVPMVPSDSDSIPLRRGQSSHVMGLRMRPSSRLLVQSHPTPPLLILTQQWLEW